MPIPKEGHTVTAHESFSSPACQNTIQDRLPAQIQEIQLNSDVLQQGAENQQDDQQGAYGGDYGEDQGDYYDDHDFIENKYDYQYESGFGFDEPDPKPPSASANHNITSPTVNIIPT